MADDAAFTPKHMLWPMMVKLTNGGKKQATAMLDTPSDKHESILSVSRDLVRMVAAKGSLSKFFGDRRSAGSTSVKFADAFDEAFAKPLSRDSIHALVRRTIGSAEDSDPFEWRDMVRDLGASAVPKKGGQDFVLGFLKAFTVLPEGYLSTVTSGMTSSRLQEAAADAAVWVLIRVFCKYIPMTVMATEPAVVLGATIILTAQILQRVALPKSMKKPTISVTKIMDAWFKVGEKLCAYVDGLEAKRDSFRTRDDEDYLT